MLIYINKKKYLETSNKSRISNRIRGSRSLVPIEVGLLKEVERVHQGRWMTFWAFAVLKRMLHEHYSQTLTLFFSAASLQARVISGNQPLTVIKYLTAWVQRTSRQLVPLRHKLMAVWCHFSSSFTL